MIYLSNRKKALILIAVAAIIITVSQLFFLNKGEPPLFPEPVNVNQPAEDETTIDNQNANLAKEEVTLVAVDVKGAVLNPGVYHLDTSQRITDAIDMAGGETEQADLNQLNLSKKIYDEMLIYVPTVDEQIQQKLIEMNDGKISINQAGVDELTTLNGIGPKKAQDIFDYREKNGAFKALEDITKVNGIGPKTFEQIKDKITLH